jgi:hypothetical protein
VSGLGNSDGHFLWRATTVALVAAAFWCSAAPVWAAGGRPPRHPNPSPQPLWRNYPLNPAHGAPAAPAPTATYRLIIPDRPGAGPTPDPRDLARRHVPAASSGSTWPTVVIVLAALTLLAGAAALAVRRWRRFAFPRPHLHLPRSSSILSASRERIFGGGRDWAVYVAGARLAAAGRAMSGARRRFRPVRRPAPERPPAQPVRPVVEVSVAEAVPVEAVVEVPPPDDPLPAIREELARARREHLALSLLLVEAADPVNVEQAIAEAARLDGAAVRSDGASGGWLLLPGVIPRRARELTETVLAAAAADGDQVAVGIAGYPRHALSTDALFRMSRRALERAAASGEAVVVASDDWAGEDSGAETEPRPARPRTAAARSRARKKRKSRPHHR